jgi:hypothetical protein
VQEHHAAVLLVGPEQRGADGAGEAEADRGADERAGEVRDGRVAQGR